ncbi:MAG TPA: PASTA domain-containing protein [Polyangiaceae bacterium]|jgi:serine/threonine-protein kinase|nr:PASTA domain-containing protein [Polyangiaceae bacterium]
MQSYSVFLLAFFTSLVTAAGTIYVAETTNMIPHETVQKVPDSVVPDLTGLSESDAKVSLATQGLILVLGPRESNTKAAANTVLKQTPRAGAKLARGGTVTASLVEAKIPVPNVVGRTTEEAGRALQESGLKLQLGLTKADDAPPGQVIAQLPAAETLAAKGESVTVDVSAGPESAEVPKVIGLNFKSAKEKIETAGYKLSARWTSLAETDTYVVLNQDPAAGTKLKKGSTVVVTVNRE